MALQVRWDSNKGFHVPELSVRECVNVNDMLQVGELHGSCHHSNLSAGAARSAVLGSCVWHLSRHSADMVTSNAI